MGILSPAVKKRKDIQSVLLAAAIFQGLLTQNSQYARAACFWVLCSELLQYNQ